MSGFCAVEPHRTHATIASLEQGCSETGHVRMSRVSGDENGVWVNLDCLGNAPGPSIVVPMSFIREALSACVPSAANSDAEIEEWKLSHATQIGEAEEATLEIGHAGGRILNRSGRHINVVWISIWGAGLRQFCKESDGRRVWMTTPQFEAVARPVLRDFGRGNEMTDQEIRRMKGEFEDSAEGDFQKFTEFLDCLDHDSRKVFPCAWLICEQGERTVESLVGRGFDRERAQKDVDWFLWNRDYRDAEYLQYEGSREMRERHLEGDRDALSVNSRKSWNELVSD